MTNSQVPIRIIILQIMTKMTLKSRLSRITLKHRFRYFLRQSFDMRLHYSTANVLLVKTAIKHSQYCWTSFCCIWRKKDQFIATLCRNTSLFLKNWHVNSASIVRDSSTKNYSSSISNWDIKMKPDASRKISMTKCSSRRLMRRS